jgi:hypothetical protein
LSLPVASNPEGMQMSIDMVIRNKIVFPASWAVIAYDKRVMREILWIIFSDRGLILQCRVLDFILRSDWPVLQDSIVNAISVLRGDGTGR